jgi:hypothetical protein
VLMLLDEEANPGSIARDKYRGKSLAWQEPPRAQFVTSNARGFSARGPGPCGVLSKGCKTRSLGKTFVG